MTNKEKKEIFKQIQQVLNFRRVKYHKSVGKYFCSLEIERPAGRLLVIELETRDNKPVLLRYYKNGEASELKSLEQFKQLL